MNSEVILWSTRLDLSAFDIMEKSNWTELYWSKNYLIMKYYQFFEYDCHS